jgi:hypothetical protein
MVWLAVGIGIVLAIAAVGGVYAVLRRLRRIEATVDEVRAAANGRPLGSVVVLRKD